MTTGGWIMMLISVGTVVIFFFTCLYKVLVGGPAPNHLHGFDIETKDKE